MKTRAIAHFSFLVMSWILSIPAGFVVGVYLIGDNPGALFGVLLVFLCSFLFFLGIEYFWVEGQKFLKHFKGNQTHSVLWFIANGIATVLVFLIAFQLAEALSVWLFGRSGLLISDLTPGTLALLSLFLLIEVPLQHGRAKLAHKLI